jgi:hypothetical protein
MATTPIYDTQLLLKSISSSTEDYFYILMISKARVTYRFRTDLCLHDSPALYAVLSLPPEMLYYVFAFDPH